MSPSVSLGGTFAVSVKGPAGVTCGAVVYFPGNGAPVTLAGKALDGGAVSWSVSVGTSMTTGSGSVNLWCQQGASSWIGTATFSVVKPPPLSSWTLSTTVTASTSNVTFAITGPIGAGCTIVIGQGSWGFTLGSGSATGMTVWNESLGPWTAGTFNYTLSCTYAGTTKMVKGTFVVS